MQFIRCPHFDFLMPETASLLDSLLIMYFLGLCSASRNDLPLNRVLDHFHNLCLLQVIQTLTLYLTHCRIALSCSFMFWVTITSKHVCFCCSKSYFHSFWFKMSHLRSFSLEIFRQLSPLTCSIQFPRENINELFVGVKLVMRSFLQNVICYIKVCG